MVFSSPEFLLAFWPICFIFFYLAGWHSRLSASIFLVLASLFFYAYWDIRYLPLLLGYAIVNYMLGLQLQKRPSKPLLTFGIVLNVGVLALFKYADFFIENINRLGADWELLHIVLPLGISFITFQKIAYLVESYRRTVQSKGILNYLLFISFFPQLIAGPIVRYEELSDQLTNPLFGKIRWSWVAAGLFIFSIGLAKKVLLADGLAVMATPVFDRAEMGIAIYTIETWQALFAYAFQIYFDFSGYSDMAIGLGLMLGVRLPDNFMSPYKAQNIIEFWRCWHMTLSRFLRDFIYIPLGGSRKGPVRRYINLFLVMLIGGLWHGASWNFVIWGGLHGLYLSVNHFWQKFGPASTPRPVFKIIGISITFFAVCLAWVFFRAETLDGAFTILSSLFVQQNQPSLLSQPIRGNMILLVASAMIIWVMPNSLQCLALFQQQLEKKMTSSVAVMGALWTGVSLGICIFVLLAGAYSEFIYFQF